MPNFVVLLIVALIVSAIGFKKYVWFISIGYGFSVCAIGLALIIMFRGQMDAGLLVQCILFMVYGLRLGGYLAYALRDALDALRREQQAVEQALRRVLGARLLHVRVVCGHDVCRVLDQARGHVRESLVAHVGAQHRELIRRCLGQACLFECFAHGIPAFVWGSVLLHYIATRRASR